MLKDLPRRDNSVGGPTETSAETKTEQEKKIAEAILSTLAFFSLYNLPLSNKRIFELLLGVKSTQTEVERMLAFLATEKIIVNAGNLFALKPWDASRYHVNQLELTAKWAKVDRYFSWLSALPFIRQVSVINSLALGTADADSDIDFFVVTKPGRLYFVRSVVIVLFRLLGGYKTREKIKDRFCFGFFVDADNLKFQSLMLQPQDPYFIFWLGSLRPVLGGKYYWQLVQDNQWLKQQFPNFNPMQRLASARKPGLAFHALKLLLEVLLWLPTLIMEPLLRRIHINHTFKLAENNTVTSTTIANAKMLKLHGYDVRPDVAAKFQEVLAAMPGRVN